MWEEMRLKELGSEPSTVEDRAPAEGSVCRVDVERWAFDLDGSCNSFGRSYTLAGIRWSN